MTDFRARRVPVDHHQLLDLRRTQRCSALKHLFHHRKQLVVANPKVLLIPCSWWEMPEVVWLGDILLRATTPRLAYSSSLFLVFGPSSNALLNPSQIVKKSFVGEEEKAPNQIAGEILSFFTRNNFVVYDRGETITFEGMMVPSRGQAALLTFCTCISLASVGLVLTITYPDSATIGSSSLSPVP